MRLGVLISGRGSNLQALINAAADPAYPAEIALVVSNVADAYGLQRAELAGIPNATLSHRGFADRRDFEEALDGRLREAGVELVCLAGFMRLLTPWFIERWHDRLINIHPSLLPLFRGLNTHRRALEAGVRFTGCTVHFVRPDVDEGPIIVQAAVPVDPADDEHSLSGRVLAAEHRCYPLAVRLIAESRVTVEGMRVRIAGSAIPTEPIVNPAS